MSDTNELSKLSSIELENAAIVALEEQSYFYMNRVIFIGKQNTNKCGVPKDGTCTRCKKRQGNHKIDRYGKATENLCCKCHIETGGAPANWHPECMQAYKEMKQKESCK